MAKEGSTVGGLMDVIGTCTSMALQYGVPLITLVDKFRHARFEPAGMTSNKDIPFAKSLIDYIFCWLGCQFIPGYADENIPNRAATPSAAKDESITTAKELVEKTRELAQKIAEAKAKAKTVTQEKQDISASTPIVTPPSEATINIPTEPADRMGVSVSARPSLDGLVGSTVTETSEVLQSEVAVLQQFNAQFAHFGDDAPACDVCGSITVRNGTCYKCYNCGNSMGCS